MQSGSDVGFQTKTFQQFLSNFNLQVRLQTTEHFLAALGVHGGEIAHQFLAGLIFGVTAPADAKSDEGGDDPDGDVGPGNHQKTSNAEPAFASLRPAGAQRPISN